MGPPVLTTMLPLESRPRLEELRSPPALTMTPGRPVSAPRLGPYPPLSRPIRDRGRGSQNRADYRRRVTRADGSEDVLDRRRGGCRCTDQRGDEATQEEFGAERVGGERVDHVHHILQRLDERRERRQPHSEWDLNKASVAPPTLPAAS